MIVLAVLVLLGLAHAPILRLLAWPLTARRVAAAGRRSIAFMATSWAPTVSSRSIAPPPGMRKRPGEKSCCSCRRTAASWKSARCDRSSRRAAASWASGGIPPSDVLAIRAEARDVWGEAHAMAGWLKEHPAATVGWPAVRSAAAGCGTCSTRSSVRPTPARAAGVPARSRSAASKAGGGAERGVKEFMYGWLELIYAWLKGDEARPLPAGAAAFQQEIRDAESARPPHETSAGVAGGWSSPSAAS